MSDIYAPVTGTIVEVNTDLADEPQRMNEDPYGDGWICVLEPADRRRARLAARRRRVPGHRRRVKDAGVAFLFCNNCGHRNPANSNFCSSCGAALDVVREEQTITFHPVDPLQDAPGPADDAVVSLADLPAGGGVLVVRAGPQAGLKVLARRSRSPGSAATPTATSSSTTSPCRAATARSSSANGAFTVRDVGSLNGTYLNQKRVEQAAIHNGDELQVGKFRLLFLEGPDQG